MNKSTKHHLKTGYFKECHDAKLCECILDHSWDELVYERLSGEEHQMYLYACRDCGQYWFGYFYQYPGSDDACSFWYMQATVNEAQDILKRKALDYEAFYTWIRREFEPASKIKFVRDEMVCIAPESYPWS